MPGKRRLLSTALTAAFAGALSITPGAAEPMLVKFNGGVLCDTADQMAEVVAQFGHRSLSDAMATVNYRTGKRSCGMTKGSLYVMMEPQRVVVSPGGKMIVVRLTTSAGEVQYTWRPMGKTKFGGQPI